MDRASVCIHAPEPLRPLSFVDHIFLNVAPDILCRIEILCFLRFLLPCIQKSNDSLRLYPPDSCGIIHAALAADVKPLLTKKTLVVSIAAGKSLATLKKALGRDVRLVRVMPNLALRAKEGMCALCPAKNATSGVVRTP